MISVEEAKAFNRENVIVDMHSHPVLKTYLFDYDIGDNHWTVPDFYPFHMQADIPKIREGGVDVVVSAAYLPERPFVESSNILDGAEPILKFFGLLSNKVEDNSTPNKPFEQTVQIISNFKDKIKHSENKNGDMAIVADDLTTLENNINNDKPIFLNAIEGGHSLGRGLSNKDDYLNNLKALYNSGVCLLTLAHFCANDITNQVSGIPPSILKTLNIRIPIDRSKGLTETGRAVVNEMLQMGMIVDLTHCTKVARDEVFSINRARGGSMRPLVFSHNGIRELCYIDNEDASEMNPDNEEILKIKDCNGVIGLIMDNYWLFGQEEKFLQYNPALSHLISTIKYIKLLTGSYDNIAIGTDYDGFTDPSDDLKDYSRMPYFTKAMINSGISKEDVKKILGGNAMRVLREGWGS